MRLARLTPLIAIALTLAALLACSLFAPAAPPTATPTGTLRLSTPAGQLPPTDTNQTPAPVCTAPACQAGEILACNGSCPNGCGISCATVTPPAPPDAYCLIVTRTPPPEAPTASSFGTPLPDVRVDPHIEVCLNAPEVTIGNPVVLVGQAVDIGLPAWTLAARENDTGDFEPVVQISGDGQVTLLGEARTVLSFVEAETSLNGVVLHFQAEAEGKVEWQLSANGEIHYGYPGPATFAGAVADVVTVYVTRP